MAGLSVKFQNVSGSRLGGGFERGKHCMLEVSVHNKKPTVLILTETRIPDRHFTGTGVFKGYRMTQHSSSGNRAGGYGNFHKERYNNDTRINIWITLRPLCHRVLWLPWIQCRQQWDLRCICWQWCCFHGSFWGIPWQQLNVAHYTI